MKNLWLTILALSLPACSQSMTYRVAVSAGKSDRQDTPVFIDLKLPESFLRASASVTFENNTARAQIETLDGGQARIWWLVSDLPAGERKTYTIKLNKVPGPAEPTGFVWKDSSLGQDKSMDLLFDNRPVLRYMYTPFDKQDIERTKKPFHHVFDPDGSRLITKGVGGKYSHHRGIFFGYNKCQIDGGVYDTWHAAQGEHQIHREILREISGPVRGGQVLKIDWNDRNGKPFIEEIRTLVAYRQSANHLLVEYTSMLRPTRGPVSLAGDRQHAGVQFRAAQEVADNEKNTRYLRPAKWSKLPANQEVNTPEYKDLPWDAICYPLGDRVYTVAYLSDPKNPDNAEFSERLYGRFGEYFPWELREDNILSVRYRWWIAAKQAADNGKDVTREQIERKYVDLADPPKVELLK